MSMIYECFIFAKPDVPEYLNNFENMILDHVLGRWSSFDFYLTENSRTDIWDDDQHFLLYLWSKFDEIRILRNWNFVFCLYESVSSKEMVTGKVKFKFSCPNNVLCRYGVLCMCIPVLHCLISVFDSSLN